MLKYCKKIIKININIFDFLKNFNKNKNSKKNFMKKGSPINNKNKLIKKKLNLGKEYKQPKNKFNCLVKNLIYINSFKEKKRIVSSVCNIKKYFKITIFIL